MVLKCLATSSGGNCYLFDSGKEALILGYREEVIY